MPPRRFFRQAQPPGDLLVACELSDFVLECIHRLRIRGVSMSAAANRSMRVSQDYISVVRIGEISQLLPNVFIAFENDKPVLLGLWNTSPHAVLDHAAHQFGSVLKDGNAEEAQISVAAKFFSELFPPASRGIPARAAESDDEHCRVAGGRVGQHNLLSRQCLGFSVRNALRRNTGTSQHHNREGQAHAQTVPNASLRDSVSPW